MVTPSYYPIKGGSESVVENLSIKLNESGTQTDIMTFNMNKKWNPCWQTKREKLDGLNVIKIPALNWYPLEHSNRITLGINLIPGIFRNYLKEYDIIHFHGEDLTFPVFSFLTKKPKIFHSHGFSLDFYKRYHLTRLILKSIADRYISISQIMTKEFAELGINPRRIRYLPNSVDPVVFHPIEKKDSNLILFVGRVTRAKGLHILVESLQHLKTKVQLVIIGPPDWDGEYFAAIKRKITEVNRTGKHIITYLGPQEQKEIIKWYQKASLFILPSFREASPVTILEALSCETPVIATNVGAISEMVCAGRNGLLVPPNNISRLAESIQSLLDREDVRTKYGREGRKSIVENFSHDVIVGRLIKIYEEVLR
jgi:glycosyltransferase involved in cell wall biosynthesis